MKRALTLGLVLLGLVGCHTETYKVESVVHDPTGMVGFSSKVYTEGRPYSSIIYYRDIPQDIDSIRITYCGCMRMATKVIKNKTDD